MVRDSFPLNIGAIRECGIKSWREGFFWPVSYKSFTEVETEVTHVLKGLIEENTDNFKSDLLLINYKIILLYSNLLNSLRVLEELNKKGLSPLYGEESVMFKGLMEGGAPLRGVLPNRFTPLRVSALKRFRNKARLMKEAVRLNGSVTSSFKAQFSDAPFIADYHFMNELAAEYISSRLDGRVKLKNTHDLLPRDLGSGLTAGQADEIRTLTERIIREVEEIATGRNLTLTEFQRKYLLDSTSELFLETTKCLAALNRHLSSLKPLHLLGGSYGNHFVRMLSTAVRNNGGTVTWFKHGEPIIYASDYYSWAKLSKADKFITYTDRSAGIMEAVTDTYPPLGKNSVRIEGAGTRIFYNLWRRESKKPLPDKIEKVMIVAKTYHSDYARGEGMAFPELVQLDWELRIINTLKKGGYKVLYKIHPGGDLRGLVSEVLETEYCGDENFKVVTGVLEDVIDTPDAFLFYTSRTTAIGQALATNKPVIYINCGLEPWIPEVYGLFSRRCRIVQAHFDERNRILFDEEGLLEAVSRKPEEPDLGFAREYMFPKGTV